MDNCPITNQRSSMGLFRAILPMLKPFLSEGKKQTIKQCVVPKVNKLKISFQINISAEIF